MADLRSRIKAFVGVGSAVAAVGAPFVPTPVVSVPVGDVVAPAVALGVVRRILRTRADQVRSRARPARLSPADSKTLGEVATSAMGAETTVDVADVNVLPAEVRSLLESVEQPEEPQTVAVARPWSIIVRVIGEPMVESTDGSTAVFGKKRSTELISWMVLNRDRLSRAAVRNAMWDLPVADSTFGTILSDLRRGLARLAPSPADGGWCPATFTDRLVLAEGITSDVELMEVALAHGSKEDLVRELSRVRDVPFAGTAYLWADLDGTTTRTMITVLDSVERLVRIGMAEGDTQSTLVAVKAGLRVMPGDEALLEIQRTLLAR